jgi:hypothetical protein
MLIDCDGCAVRGRACGDCVVTVLLGAGPGSASPVDLDSAERAAIEVLAGSGLVPPLRLVSAEVPPETGRNTRESGPERAVG